MLTVFYSVVDFIYRVLRVQTLGVKGIIFSEDKKQVLLVKHSYRPGWHLPGGRVDAFEPVMRAVSREVLEETGVIVPEDSLTITGIYDNFEYGRNDHVVVFAGTASGMKEGFKLPTLEILAAEFFSLDALPDDISNPTKRRLSEIGAVKVCPW